MRLLRPTRYLLLLALLAVGCGTQAVEPTMSPAAVERDVAPTVVAATPVTQATVAPPPTPTAVVVATSAEDVTVAADPTATALPIDTPEPQAALTYGLTEDGAYFVGFPDAPVTMIDYSDFL